MPGAKKASSSRKAGRIPTCKRLKRKSIRDPRGTKWQLFRRRPSRGLTPNTWRRWLVPDVIADGRSTDAGSAYIRQPRRAGGLGQWLVQEGKRMGWRREPQKRRRLVGQHQPCGERDPLHWVARPDCWFGDAPEIFDLEITGEISGFRPRSVGRTCCRVERVGRAPYARAIFAPRQCRSELTKAASHRFSGQGRVPPAES
jgi:hypothetical protein